MTNFNKIPSKSDWGVIVPDDYYPDYEYENFLHKSYSEIIEDVSQPPGFNIIVGLSQIPEDPFRFYTACILDGMLKKKIYLGHLDLFSLIISIIGNKYKEIPSSYFEDFIEPIKKIIQGIEAGEIAYCDEVFTETYEEFKAECTQLLDTISGLSNNQ